MNKEFLGIFARQLIFWNISEFLMHNDGLLSLYIEYWCTFSYLSETTNDGSMNEPNWLVNIRIINAWNQCSLGLLDKIFLNCSYARYILDVFIELRVNCHMFSAYSKTLLMFVFIGNANDKRYAWWVFLHHLKHEADSEVHTFNYEWFISSLVVINDLFQLCLYLVALVLIAHERPLLFWLYVFWNL